MSCEVASTANLLPASLPGMSTWLGTHKTQTSLDKPAMISLMLSSSAGVEAEWPLWMTSKLDIGSDTIRFVVVGRWIFSRAEFICQMAVHQAAAQACRGWRVEYSVVDGYLVNFPVDLPGSDLAWGLSSGILSVCSDTRKLWLLLLYCVETVILRMRLSSDGGCFCTFYFSHVSW